MKNLERKYNWLKSYKDNLKGWLHTEENKDKRDVLYMVIKDLEDIIENK